MQKKFGFATITLALFVAAHSNGSDYLVSHDYVHATTRSNLMGNDEFSPVLPIIESNTNDSINKRDLEETVVTTVKLFRNKENAFWLGKIKIGTSRRKRQEQYFYVIFDTGSPYLWVTSSACREPGFSKYRSLLSRTRTKIPGVFRVNYAGGSFMEGIQYSDKVTIGEMTMEVSFGSVVKHVSFPSDRGDGIFGLYPSIIGEPRFNSFYAIQTAYPHFNPVAAFYFGTRHPELHLGEIKEVYVGKIQYHPLIPGMVVNGVLTKTWTIAGGDIFLGDEELAKCTWSQFDTGAGWILGPMDEVQKIYSRILPGSRPSELNGQFFYPLPCNHATGLPVNVNIRWNNQKWMIQHLAVPASVDWCYGIFVGHPHLTGWLIGDKFMQGMYIIFDAMGQRIGLAKAM